LCRVIVFDTVLLRILKHLSWHNIEEISAIDRSTK